MEDCFSGTTEGKIAQQEYEKKVQLMVEEELKKHNIPKFESEEKNRIYQQEVRKIIEDRIRDKIK